MTQFEIMILALALSADAFAVSISGGVSVKNVKISDSLKMALFFGIFQGIMPMIGWIAGASFSKYLEKYGKWVALVLLSFIGIKMIYESFKQDEEKNIKYFNTSVLLLLAIATSIDAFAAGLSLKLLNINIFIPAIIITITTFITSLLGLLIGKKAGVKFGQRSEFVGGLILVGIGIKLIFI